MLIPQIESLFARMLLAHDVEMMPCPHPHGRIRTCLWLAGIFISCTVYFLIYFYPAHLHDISHFATAGVSLIRDQKDLLYPYNPYAPGGLGPAYEYFQNNTIHFDMRTNYPSKLYSAIYGSICAAKGNMRLEYAQWMSFSAFLISNVLLYLIGRRFLLGIELICFLLSVMFLPIMRPALSPGTDIYGYMGCLFLLWLCLCLRVNPFVLGLCAGILTHFRGQMLSVLLVFPFIIKATTRKASFRQGFVPMLLGFLLTYSAMTVLFNVMIKSTEASNPVGFYVNFFKSSMYGINQSGIILNKFVASIVNLFDKSQLFIFAGIALFCALHRNAPLQKNLAIAALVYTGLPVALYSFDRYSPPHSRYYMFAVPLIGLAGFIALKSLQVRFNAITSRWSIYILTIIILFAWHNSYVLSFETLNMASIKSRAQFLDFEGVEKALATHFKDDDIVIVNHSLPTGLSKLHNVIYVPSFKLFQNGDNSKIKGIIFVFSHSVPNDFFEPKEWLQEGTLPQAITDLHEITFKRVYVGTSTILNPNGSAQNEAYFFIYKNISKQ